MNDYHTPGDGLDAPTRGKFGALETIKELTPLYAKAKADAEYLAQFRKSKKALLMIEGEKEGHKTGAMQERYAYAHPEYVGLLEGLRAATEECERLRFTIEAAKIACSIWQTKMASERAERKAF
jgi:hypothetical protein